MDTACVEEIEIARCEFDPVIANIVGCGIFIKCLIGNMGLDLRRPHTLMQSKLILDTIALDGRNNVNFYYTRGNAYTLLNEL